MSSTRVFGERPLTSSLPGWTVATATIVCLVGCRDATDYDCRELSNCPLSRDAAAETSGQDAGGPTDEQVRDGGPSDADASGGPAEPACDLSADFQAPVPVNAVNGPGDDDSAQESADGLTLYFSRTTFDVNGKAIDGRLFSAKRPSLNSPFGSISELEGGVFHDPSSFDRHPHVGPDGNTVFWTRTKDPTAGGDDDIYFSTRLGPDNWSPPAGVVGANRTDEYHSHPTFFRPDSKLFFTKLFVTLIGQAPFHEYHILEGSYLNGAVSGVTQLGFAQSMVSDGSPVISPDGRTLYFARIADVWKVTRASTGVPFAEPVAVSAMNTDKEDLPASISTDGCRLYLVSNRAGSARYDVWVASRPAK